MWESLSNVFVGVDIWSIIIKVLLTALLSAGATLICTLIGKIIAKNKDSKIRRYAKTCVKAAEQKFPNEGKKMGPEKMSYVMDQLAIKFPRIKENTYLYNIAEAAVLELNRDMQKEAAVKEFEEKYGEKPLAILEGENSKKEINNNRGESVEKSSASTNSTKTPKKKNLVSF